jgi:hypothetical protein
VHRRPDRRERRVPHVRTGVRGPKKMGEAPPQPFLTRETAFRIMKAFENYVSGPRTLVRTWGTLLFAAIGTSGANVEVPPFNAGTSDDPGSTQADAGDGNSFGCQACNRLDTNLSEVWHFDQDEVEQYGSRVEAFL